MLSLVGSIQPDPFSPEHVPQGKVSHRADTPQRQPSPRSILEGNGSEATDDEELDALASGGPRLVDDEVEQRRKEKGKEMPATRERKRGKEEKAKRKRKENTTVTKSEHKAKRKRTS
jgi:DNA-directed RNA polymerase I subunit RPA43